MFAGISARFDKTIKKLSGKGRLTDDNIKEALKDVRKALVEADVSIKVTQSFVAQVRKRALGQEVMDSLSPGQAFIKIVKQELTLLMGEHNEALDLSCQPPAVILLAGLQGSGKTTTSAKLASFLKNREKKSVLLVSTDVYRPAAIEQLQSLAASLEIPCFATDPKARPQTIVGDALDQAKRQAIEVVIVDTAGRLHVDQDMMDEIKTLHKTLNPIETLFVVDSMTGQDAVNTAKVFDEALALTGVILSKADGDARGGAALSVRHVTGKPIKFMGISEKTDGLEAFHPDRIASRILGQGDLQTLLETAEHKIDKQKAKQVARKLERGQGFNLEDFRDQLLEMNKLGDMNSLLDKLPGMGQIKEVAAQKLSEHSTGSMLAIISSMTRLERKQPDLIRGSRKRRIAMGSGTSVQDVNKLLKQFSQLQKMSKRFAKKGSMSQMMRQMQGMLPPGGEAPF